MAATTANEKRAITTIAEGQEATTEFQPVYNLDRFVSNPGRPRALVAADREHPNGSEDARSTDKTVLQQHVDFFDLNHDGVITVTETFKGLRRVGFNFVNCIIGVVLIHGMMSYVTVPSIWPDPFFRIYVKNIHRGKHGSDSETFDTEGRFVPQKFEEIFSKYDRTQKGALTFREGVHMLREQRNAWDFVGWTTAMFEWLFLWLIAADKGVLTKEACRQCMDGTLFVHLAEERSRRFAGGGVDRGGVVAKGTAQSKEMNTTGVGGSNIASSSSSAKQ